MRAFLAAVSAAFLLAACVATALPRYASEMLAASVLVADDRGHGSGTLVGPSTILTAGHVAKENDTFIITFSDGHKVTAHTQWISEIYDAALLHLDTPQTGAMDIDCSPLEWGERFSYVGNPSILRQNLSEGYVSSVAPSSNEGLNGSKLVAVSALMNPGDSGAGIFSEAGKVRGIVIGFLFTQIGPFYSQSGNGLVLPSSVVCEELGIES